ncbi:MAG: tetratricopeptide repeat protein [Sulfurovum sp.]|nr:tetratricopeptide repeat protein [Sulfurovaceae bacterium]
MKLQKLLIALLLLKSSLMALEEYTFELDSIKEVKKVLYEDVTEDNINNNALSSVKAKALMSKINKQFDREWSNTKNSLNSLAIAINKDNSLLLKKKTTLITAQKSLEDLITKKEAEESNINNLKKSIQDLQRNKNSSTIKNEFSSQGYYISYLIDKRTKTDTEMQKVLQNRTIVQSAKDLQGELVRSTKVLKNYTLIENQIIASASAKVNILTIGSHKTYPYNFNGRKLLIYSTKVEVYPFTKSDNREGHTSSGENTESQVFFIENSQDLRDTLSLIQRKFPIGIQLDTVSIQGDLESLQNYNKIKYSSLKATIQDFEDNIIDLKDNIKGKRSELTYIKKGLILTEQKISRKRNKVQKIIEKIEQLDKSIIHNKSELKKLQSQQIYKRAQRKDLKSNNALKDTRRIIDDLLEGLDTSFEHTLVEIEEILNNKEYSKTITKTTYKKSYISSQLIPYYVDNAVSQNGAIVVLQVRFDGTSRTEVLSWYENLYYDLKDFNENYYYIPLVLLGILVIFLYLRRRGKADRLNSMGIAYRNKKEYDKAIECYQKALEIEPNYELCKNNLKIAQDKQK